MPAILANRLCAIFFYFMPPRPIPGCPLFVSMSPEPLATAPAMPAPPHAEHHFTGSARVRDLVIGMSDGLTVPFALAAGLSGAAVATRIVVTAGLAEIAAGSIAMGLGG